MKAKKGLAIGLLILVGVAVFAFVYMWSLGVFSGSAVFGERNTALENAVTDRVEERLNEAFKDHESLSLFEAESYAALYVEDYPLDKYSETTEISDEELDKIIKNNDFAITAELKFSGEGVEFSEYKVIAYQITDMVSKTIEAQFAQLQLFYYRLPTGSETENVMQYESKVPGYLFGKDQKTVVTASGVHFVVEADEELTQKTKIYYGVKEIYLVVLTVTVVGLTILLIVRSVNKRKRYKN